MRKTLIVSALLLCAVNAAGCLTRPVVAIPPASCASLIPDGWKAPVDATPIPDAVTPSGNPVADALEAARRWAGAFTAESGQRAIETGRKTDTIGIFTRCEALANVARPK